MGLNKALSSVEAYDLGTNQATDLADMNNAHAHVAATVGPDCKIYAVTDDLDPFTGTNQYEVFDGTSWSAGTIPASSNTFYAAVTGHNGHIYALANGTEFELNPSDSIPKWQEFAGL